MRRPHRLHSYFKHPLLLGTACAAILLSPLMPAISVDAQSRFSPIGQSQVLTIDNRGVLTMAPLLEKVTPAVVSIEIAATSKSSNDRTQEQSELLERFFGGRIPQQQDRTNNADEIFVTLEDRREIEAELVGSDEKTDVAVLKIKAGGLSDLDFAKNGNAKVGDYVIAVGNPFGLSSTVTSGIISALGRDTARGGNYADFIQTDASINPGNSGGALVNSKGQLIGMNTAIISRSGGNQGIGFAVPVKMIDGGHSKYSKRP